MDYDLSSTNKEHSGLDACNFLIEHDINCPEIIIHPIHPKADNMKETLSKHYKNIKMEEYDFDEVAKEYDKKKKNVI